MMKITYGEPQFIDTGRKCAHTLIAVRINDRKLGCLRRDHYTEDRFADRWYATPELTRNYPSLDGKSYVSIFDMQDAVEAAFREQGVPPLAPEFR